VLLRAGVEVAEDTCGALALVVLVCSAGCWACNSVNTDMRRDYLRGSAIFLIMIVIVMV
jgi:hypothetical protein